MAYKRNLMGTPKRDPQEYSRNIIEYTVQGPYVLLCSYYIIGVLLLVFT